MRQLLNFDVDVFGIQQPHHAGVLEQWLAKWVDHPESGRALFTEEGDLAGYWSTACLSPADFAAMRRGKLFDGELTPDRLQYFDLPGGYKLYVVTIAIKLKFRSPECLRALLHSFAETLETLAEQDNFFDEICANAFTAQGASLCHSIGLKHVADHKDQGRIFAARLMPMDPLPFFSSRPQLIGAYGRASALVSRSGRDREGSLLSRRFGRP